MRVVPGALSGNTRGGVHIDQTKMTGGISGLERLTMAYISASWIYASLRAWADDVVSTARRRQGKTELSLLVLCRDVNGSSECTWISMAYPV